MNDGNARKGRGRIVLGVVAVGLLACIAVAMPARSAPRAKARSVTTPHAATTSFHFDGIPVRSALQLIAEEGDFNLVVSDSVQGTITLRLDDVTWEQALDIVLRLKGLGQRIDGDTRSVDVSPR